LNLALFVTCVTDTLFPEAGRATVELLERLGHTVQFPQEQTCCGQMHANSGYGDEALPLVRRFVDVFGDPSFDAVVAPSGSCVGMVRQHYARLAAEAGDTELQARISALNPRVFELSEFLVGQLGVEDVGAYFPHRVVYHASCHSLRLIEVGDAPLRLLRNVRGLQLAELSEPRSCCGFGGTFAVKNADTSIAMLSDKIRDVLDSEAEICTSADSSCLLHIGGGLSRQRTGVKTMHIAEILAATEHA
jgi:L-lactate dehydrogenase complex protein LldE